MNDKRTVALMTMYKKPNFGSALQVYATNKIVEKLGFDCITINYFEPDFEYRWRGIKSFARFLISRAIYLRRNISHFAFLRKTIRQTRRYENVEELRQDPPLADIYLTGSDQTFSPVYAIKDPKWFLDFAPEGRRLVSYASSLATSQIPSESREAYRAYLSRYHALSVREESSVKLLREEFGLSASCCCDPTLLLTRDEWASIAKRSPMRKKGKRYILVYIMAYLTNPYPQLYRIVDELQAKLGLEVIYLMGCKQDIGRPNSRWTRNATPQEFIDLMFNADFIVTSSFHGLVFSLLSGRPYMALAAADERHDNRLMALLRGVHAEDHAVKVPIMDDVHVADLSRYEPSSESTELVFRMQEKSIEWLKEALG